MGQESGVRIDAYLKKYGPVPPGKAAKIAAEILAQIEELASLGATSSLSGISTNRIFITAKGEVVLLEPEDELPAAVSAPSYASPEEIRGGQPDEISAIYSFGCTLFEILTGRPPFAGDDPRAILKAHLSVQAPDPRSLRPELPPALAQTVCSFLAKDPAERPGSAREASEAIRSALARRPSLRAAPKPQPIPRAQPFPKAPIPHRGPRPLQRRPDLRTTSLPASPSRKLASSRRPGAVIPAGSQRFPRPVVGSRQSARLEAGYEDEEFAPPPKRPWIFCWFGLAMGVLLSLIMIVVKSGEKKPLHPPLTQQELQEISKRIADFNSLKNGEDQMAKIEFEQVPLRITYKERAESLSRILDKYPHTRMVPEIVSQLSKLREEIEFQESLPDQGGQNPWSAEESSFEDTAAQEPEPPAQDSPDGKSDAIQLPPSDDDIGSAPGGDDGESEL